MRGRWLFRLPLDQINLSLNSSRLQTVLSRPSLVQRYRNDPLQVSGNSLVGPFLTHGRTLVLREALQTATSGLRVSAAPVPAENEKGVIHQPRSFSRTPIAAPRKIVHL